MAAEDSERPQRNRVRDFWTLDVPLVLVLIICTVITVIEIGRAGDGVWRAWVYSFEWPLIALFAIWMWWRFRTEGNPASSAARRWRERVAQYESEAQVAAQAEHDPQLRAWLDHVDELHRHDPPGTEPPSSSA